MSCHIKLEGPIEKGDQEQLRAEVAAYAKARQELRLRGDSPPQLEWMPSIPRICLDSPGGSYNEALEILEQDFGTFATAIGKGMRCESACALIFMAGASGDGGSIDLELGGRVLHPLGKLGFHAPKLLVPEGQYDKQVVDAVYSQSVRHIARLVGQMNKISFPESLLERMLLTPPEQMFYVSTAGHAIDWRIRVAPAVFPSELSPLAVWNACYNARNLVAEALGEARVDIYQGNFWQKPPVFYEKYSNLIGEMPIPMGSQGDVSCKFQPDTDPILYNWYIPTTSAGMLMFEIGEDHTGRTLFFDPYANYFVTRATPLTVLARTDDSRREYALSSELSAPVAKSTKGICGWTQGDQLTSYSRCVETITETPREDLSASFDLFYQFEDNEPIEVSAEGSFALGLPANPTKHSFRFQKHWASMEVDGMPDAGDDYNEPGVDDFCLGVTNGESPWCTVRIFRMENGQDRFLFWEDH
ncbi:hypothetical protein [Shimia sediminis]|uniref:hypothetical protein n=1 Tax=Shimia sediminis TaxID=2497945 RepID=UPI000F8DAE5F|nr:hypothetical protein [Shimia sediminis]